MIGVTAQVLDDWSSFLRLLSDPARASELLEECKSYLARGTEAHENARTVQRETDDRRAAVAAEVAQLEVARQRHEFDLANIEKAKADLDAFRKKLDADVEAFEAAKRQHADEVAKLNGARAEFEAAQARLRGVLG
jgi:DNA repair ATPase RecN